MFEDFIQAMKEKRDEIQFTVEQFFDRIDAKEKEYEERFGDPDETDLSDLLKGDTDE